MKIDESSGTSWARSSGWCSWEIKHKSLIKNRVSRGKNGNSTESLSLEWDRDDELNLTLWIQIVKETFALFDTKQNSAIICTRHYCFSRDFRFHSWVYVFDNLISNAFSVYMFENSLWDQLRCLWVWNELALDSFKQLWLADMLLNNLSHLSELVSRECSVFLHLNLNYQTW